VAKNNSYYFGTAFDVWTWDQCYDFKKVFSENSGGKIGVFDLKPFYVAFAKNDHNIAFQEKNATFFRRESHQIAIITLAPARPLLL
jgi:hypothetical protein